MQYSSSPVSAGSLDEISRCFLESVPRFAHFLQVYRLYILEAELFPTYLEVSFNYPARHKKTFLVQMHTSW